MEICFCKFAGYFISPLEEVTVDDLKIWKAELLTKPSLATDFERHSALFLERAAKVTLEEPIAP